MSSGHNHGVYTNQVPTNLVVTKESMSALPIIFGCAPIHRIPVADQKRVRPCQIGMVYRLSEAGTQYGIQTETDDFEHWTLSEAAYVYFMLFNVGPVIFANLFDPDVHRRPVIGETLRFIAGKGTLAHPDLIGGATIVPDGGGDPFVADVDYLPLKPFTRLSMI